MLVVLVLTGCRGTRITPYAEAAKAHEETLGGDTDYKARGEKLSHDILMTLAPLDKRIKTTEGLLNATGMATTGAGAAGTTLTQVLTTDESKKLIGAVSSMVATVVGGVQILISKTDAAVEYADACKAMLQAWAMSDKGQDAYVKLLTKAEAIHDRFPKFATYTTDIEATTSAKKVSPKEVSEF
jgi:hypothetical protein